MNQYCHDEFNIINFETIDSTSTYLKKHYLSLPNLTLVFAKEQTNGHGRMQRKWVSSNGDSLLFSLLFLDKKVFQNFASLSLLAATKIYRFISKYTSNVSIKWPNDIYVNDKKICGILMESVSIDGNISALVLGIGININNQEFPLDLTNKATSLYKEENMQFTLEKMQEEIIPYIREIVDDLYSDNKEYLQVVKSHNYLKGKYVEITLENKVEKALVIDINEDNTLLVKKGDQLLSLSVGEVLPIH